MQNQSHDELNKIAKIRRIKNYTKMSKEDSIISLLKSKQSFAELYNNNFDNDRIKGIKKSLFDEKIRDKFSKKEITKIKNELHEIKNKRKIFLNRKKRRLNNTLLNQKWNSILVKNIRIMIVMILITME